MSPPTRTAGWGTGAFGSLVTWTVAEGRKGRRWREVVSRGPTVIHSLMLETDPDGRFSHLELARSDGLWTFHPESNGTLHGNHVGGKKPGIQHVAGWAFGPEDALVVEGSPIGLASVAWRWAGVMSPDGPATIEVGGVLIRAGGELVQVPALQVERLTARRWRVGDGSPFELDGAGLPVLVDGTVRPLEAD